MFVSDSSSPCCRQINKGEGGKDAVVARELCYWHSFNPTALRAFHHAVSALCNITHTEKWSLLTLKLGHTFMTYRNKAERVLNRHLTEKTCKNTAWVAWNKDKRGHMCNTLIHFIIGRKQSLLRFNRAPGDALGAPRSEVHSPSRAEQTGKAGVIQICAGWMTGSTFNRVYEQTSPVVMCSNIGRMNADANGRQRHVALSVLIFKDALVTWCNQLAPVDRVCPGRGHLTAFKSVSRELTTQIGFAVTTVL